MKLINIIIKLSKELHDAFEIMLNQIGQYPDLR